MTRVYLAAGYSSQNGFLEATLKTPAPPFPVLVTTPYIARFFKMLARSPECLRQCSAWMLDSGAFTVRYSGGSVDLERYCEFTKSTCWDECVALDVIGDAEGTLRNALWLKAHGSLAYPVFHYGEPLEILDEYVRQFPKVGLASQHCATVSSVDALRFYETCFARHWPFPYHSFGWIGGKKEKPLDRFPFYSGDSSSWVQGPASFGNWGAAFEGLKQRVKYRHKQSLRQQVDAVLRMFSHLPHRWRKEMAVLDQMVAERGGLRWGGPGAPVADIAEWTRVGELHKGMVTVPRKEKAA